MRRPKPELLKREPITPKEPVNPKEADRVRKEQEATAKREEGQAVCNALNAKYGEHITATPCTYGTSVMVNGRQDWDTGEGRAAADKALAETLDLMTKDGVLKAVPAEKKFGIAHNKIQMVSSTVIPVADLDLDLLLGAARTTAQRGGGVVGRF